MRFCDCTHAFESIIIISHQYALISFCFLLPTNVHELESQRSGQHVLYAFQLKHFQFTSSAENLHLSICAVCLSVGFICNDDTSKIHFAFSLNTPCDTIVFKVPIRELACELNLNTFKGKADVEPPNNTQRH